MSQSPTRRTLTLIGILWIIALLVLIAVYFTLNFTQYMDTVPKETLTSLKLTSVFSDGESIPAVYTCDEKQISPPLTIKGEPAATQSYVLIVEDRDVPKSLKADGVFLHWSVFNIPVSMRDIGTGEKVGTEGASGNGVAGYVGPCPPTNSEPTEHRYYFDLYALDTSLNLESGADIAAVRAAMDGHVLAHTTLMGRYARKTE